MERHQSGWKTPSAAIRNGQLESLWNGMFLWNPDCGRAVLGEGWISNKIKTQIEKQANVNIKIATFLLFINQMYTRSQL